MSKTDPMWVFENYGTAAELIDELEAELEAARKQSPIGHVALGSHTGVVFYSHMPQLPDGTKLYALPPLAGKVSVPEGWLIELGFDVLDKPFRFVDSKSHTPTIKVILPACEVDESSAWDLRDEVAARISALLATPSMEV